MCPKSVLNKPLSAKLAIFGWGSALLLWVVDIIVDIVKVMQ